MTEGRKHGTVIEFKADRLVGLLRMKARRLPVKRQRWLGWAVTRRKKAALA